MRSLNLKNIQRRLPGRIKLAGQSKLVIFLAVISLLIVVGYSTLITRALYPSKTLNQIDLDQLIRDLSFSAGR